MQDLLHSGMTAMQLGGSLQGVPTPDVTITVGAPDRVVVQGNNAFSLLNVFLYNLVRNSGWANVDLPSRNSQGDRISNPPLGVDLYYLLTAYGTKDFDAEVLLGGALQVLQDTPGMDRDEIREALAHGVNLPNNVALCGLADQVEGLRITPLPMNTEEIVRLWSAFQCNYRPSVAYVVSVVLLQSARSSRPTLPVRARNVYAITLSPATIDAVSNSPDPTQPITLASTVQLTGESLDQPGLSLWVNGIDLSAGIGLLAAQKILFTFPAAATWPSGLYVGAMTVQLQYQQQLGTPPAPHPGVSSNVASFSLAPSVAVAVAGPAFRLTFSTPVAARQHVTVDLTQYPPPANPNAYQFAAPDGNGVVAPATDTLIVLVPFTGVPHGAYLVQVGVDGVLSPLTVAAGAYSGPTVVV
jgi:hypothetical protein